MNDSVVQQPSEAGSELARFRRGIMRQHFYGVVTGMCQSLIDAKAGAYEREFGSNPHFLDLCRTDALIQIAEEFKRMNDLTERFAPSAAHFLQTAMPNSQPQEYLCTICAGSGTAQIDNSASIFHRAMQILFHHSQVNPRCPAMPPDVVFKDTSWTEEEWKQKKEEAIQASRNGRGGHVV